MEVLAPPAANWYVASVALSSRRCSRVVAVAARECVVLVGAAEGGESVRVHGILRFRPKLRISALAAFEVTEVESATGSSGGDDGTPRERGRERQGGGCV